MMFFDAFDSVEANLISMMGLTWFICYCLADLRKMHEAERSQFLEGLEETRHQFTQSSLELTQAMLKRTNRSTCQYCDGEPGTGRTCKNCGAPNNRKGGTPTGVNPTQEICA